MPVLIDFGTVEHMVFSSKSTEDIPPETIVGKVGYPPEEQILNVRFFLTVTSTL
jgi:hypothetical protein